MLASGDTRAGLGEAGRGGKGPTVTGGVAAEAEGGAGTRPAGPKGPWLAAVLVGGVWGGGGRNTGSGLVRSGLVGSSCSTPCRESVPMARVTSSATFSE